MADITPARKLFDLLVSRDFDPEMLDSSGKPAPDPAEAEIFSFDFRAHSGNDYGTVVIMLGDDNDLEVYCSDNVGRGMEGNDKNDWFAFLEQLKNFAVRNFMSFGIKNLNRLLVGDLIKQRRFFKLSLYAKRFANARRTRNNHSANFAVDTGR